MTVEQERIIHAELDAQEAEARSAEQAEAEAVPTRSRAMEPGDPEVDLDEDREPPL